MTTYAANVEARRLALLAAAECADKSAAALVAFAAALRQPAHKLENAISPQDIQPKIAPPHEPPSASNSRPHPVE